MEANIIQEIELKYTSLRKRSKYPLNNAQRIYDTFLDLWNKDTIELFEEFKIIYVNRSNHIIGIYNHSKGGIAGTLADVRLIMGMALKCAASGIILGNNHPSGNVNPSVSDKSLTQKIKACCETFDILLVDHLIITNEGFYSFMENDLL